MKSSLMKRVALNPMFITGMSLPIIIGGATTMRNGLVLSAATMYLTVIVTFLLKAFAQKMNKGARRALSAVIAAVAYIPFAYVLITRLGYMYESVGIFLPVLCVSAVIIYSPSEREKFVTLSKEMRHNMWISFCFSFVLCGMGALREYLSIGKILGFSVTDKSIIPDASYPYVGFVLFGLICAVAQAVRNHVQRKDDEYDE